MGRFFYDTSQPQSRMPVLYIMFDTSHTAAPGVSPVQFTEPHLRYQVFFVRVDSVCINKRFPMKGVTQMADERTQLGPCEECLELYLRSPIRFQ